MIKADKKAIVINGQGGVGKDTLCDLCAKHYSVFNISSITPIKDIAKLFGWAGEKTDKARKFLADLKAVSVEYNDFPTKWMKVKYDEFIASDYQVMFVHIREPEEIAKFVSMTNGEAKTLLIRGGERLRRDAYGNSADDCVENYFYDYYFTNDRSLDDAERDFVKLIKDILSGGDLSE